MTGWLWADWPAPANVCAGVSTRQGGVSAAPWNTLNLGLHVGDDPMAVAENRRRLADNLALPAEPCWLQQVHGTAVAVLPLDAPDAGIARSDPGIGPGAATSPCNDAPLADAAVSFTTGCVAAVMTADCLPVVLTDRGGSCIGVAHAGWRGLAAGVLEATVAALARAPGELIAWLGPAISQPHFEVGTEVRVAFLAADPGATQAFVANARGRWQADLYALARRRLGALGVEQVYGGTRCSYAEAEVFFSHRRDGRCGRMVTLAWLR